MAPWRQGDISEHLLCRAEDVSLKSALSRSYLQLTCNAYDEIYVQCNMYAHTVLSLECTALMVLDQKSENGLSMRDKR